MTHPLKRGAWLSLSLLPLLMLMSAGCDDETPPVQSEAGVAAGTQAGTQAGDEAGTQAGAVSGTQAGDEAGTQAGDEAGAQAGVEPPPLDLPCNTAIGELPADLELVELAYDDGVGVASVAEQSWEIAGVAIAEAHIKEAVRFAFERPMTVYQIKAQYNGPSRFRNDELKLSLRADFGYNGFDHWQGEALWEGSRCGGEVKTGEWLTFTLTEPLELTGSGLVYVVSEREYPDEPAWLFDGSEPSSCEPGDPACCEAFHACRSSWTFPELTSFEGTPFWRGLATTFRYDYLVRLVVAPSPALTPEQLTFERAQGEGFEGLEVGGRQAWGDFDDDGDDDLLTSGPRLYRNLTTERGALAFEEVTMSGLEGKPGSGGVWGDYDNDGCLDVLLFAESTTQSEALMRGHCDGTFTDVTERSGLTDVLNPELNEGLFSSYRCDDDEAQDRAPTASAAWVDLDADGLLDLYLPNFLCWGNGDAYLDHVWHNMGDGTFEPWSGRFGFEGGESSLEPLASRDVSPIDVDQDGDVDVMVGNYRLHKNRFYENRLLDEGAEGLMVERAAEVGLEGELTALGAGRSYGHTIGVAWGDLNGDERLDAVVANLAHPRFYHFSNKTEVLLQTSEGRFEDLQGDMSSWLTSPKGGAGLRYQETHSVPVLGDVDLDGHLDLMISAVYDGRPTDVYRGVGDGHFIEAHHLSGVNAENGWGMALSDLDNDGDLDLSTSRGLFLNARPHALRGEGASAGDAWLAVRLVGDVQSNRAAIGATLRAKAGERVWVRVVEGSSAQGNQNSQTLHIGLGEVEELEWLEARFIGGEVVRYEGPFSARQRLKLFESGRAEPF